MLIGEGACPHHRRRPAERHLRHHQPPRPTLNGWLLPPALSSSNDASSRPPLPGPTTFPRCPCWCRRCHWPRRPRPPAGRPAAARPPLSPMGEHGPNVTVTRPTSTARRLPQPTATVSFDRLTLNRSSQCSIDRHRCRLRGPLLSSPEPDQPPWPHRPPPPIAPTVPALSSTAHHPP